MQPNLDISNFAASLSGFLPELALAVAFVVALGVAFAARGRWENGVRGVVLAGYVGALVLLGTQYALLYGSGPKGEWTNPFGAEWLFKGSEQPYGFGMVVVDGMAILVKALVGLAALAVLLVSFRRRDAVPAREPGNAIGSLMLAPIGLGLYILCGANDLLLMFAALALVMVASAVAIGSRRDDPASAEAAMKYAVHGGAMLAVTAMGIAMMYGLLGATNFAELGLLLGAPNTENTLANPLALASLMVVAGIAALAAVAPFHFWAPDVIEGAPADVAAFVAVASKAAGLAMFARFVVTLYPASMQGFNWSPIIAGLAVLTMSLGNLAALQQTNLRRMLAYITIAHGGYMLAALAGGTAAGLAALLANLVLYVVFGLAALLAVRRVGEALGSAEIEDVRGLGRSSSMFGAMLAICVLGFAAVPVTGGFLARALLVGAVVDGGPGFVWLAGAIVVNSLVALGYTLRLLSAMYMEPPVAAPPNVRPGRTAFVVIGVLVLAGVALAVPAVFAALNGIAEESLRGLLPALRETVAR